MVRLYVEGTRMLMRLPRFCGATGMLAKAHTDEEVCSFYAPPTWQHQPYPKPVRAASEQPYVRSLVTAVTQSCNTNISHKLTCNTNSLSPL